MRRGITAHALIAMLMATSAVLADDTPATGSTKSGHAQARGTSTRVVHEAIYWLDSIRPEPWTPDATDHRGILVQAYHRAGAAEPAPLVLFSTGRNEAPTTYADLAEALARDGYVVAIVDHLGERSGQRLPDGAAVPNRLAQVAPDRKSPSFEAQDAAFTRGWVELRAADLTSARVHLQALAAEGGNELSGLLNTQAAAYCRSSAASFAVASLSSCRMLCSIRSSRPRLCSSRRCKKATSSRVVCGDRHDA